MYSSLIVVTLVLASQISGTDQRYQGNTAGQLSATSPAPGTGGAPGTVTPLTNPASPATNGAGRNTTATPNSTSPYAPNRPSNFSSQPTTPAFNSGGTRPSMGQTQSPPSYPGQTGFPANEAAISQQPPSKSAVMMKAMLTPPLGSQLRGEPVLLIDVVSSGRTRNEQTQRIEAYWDLCSSVADYNLGVREQEEVRSLASAALRQSGALQEAEKKMLARTDTALRAARASQFRLAGFIGRGPNNLPLPADMPHCGTYTSRYEQVFAGRSSPEAQGLAQLLPMRYTELDEAAISVSGAEEWFKTVMSRSENAGADGPVRALELLALERRAFVQIARDYNRRIARYSELATPGQISPDRLTGMLIRRPASSTSSPPTRQSSGVETSQQQTFANKEDWLPAEKPAIPGDAKVDSAVRPASATQSGPRQEHSVVVQPQ